MFCNKCGSQIPDGSVACTNCGAPTGVAQPKAPSNGAFVNPFAKGFGKDAIFGTGASINFIVLALAVIGLICMFLPGAKSEAFKYFGSDSESVSIISSLFAFGSEVSLMALMIPFMGALIALCIMKKDMLVFLTSSVNFVFTLICFCVAKNNFSDKEIKLGWGFWVYFVLTILMVALAFFWPTIDKLMKNRPPKQIVYVQQVPYGQPYAQAPQQPYAQAPQQPYAQAPQQQPQQPQQ